MALIRLEDVTMIYPFQKVTGLFDRKQKQKILIDRIRTQTEFITNRFAPRALLTVLDGDLVKFLKDNL